MDTLLRAILVRLASMTPERLRSGPSRGLLQGPGKGKACLRKTGDLVETGAVVDGKTIQVFRNGRQFNDSGMFSIWRKSRKAKDSLWTTSLIVATGDTVEGRTVSDFHHIVGMNDRGDLAFLAHFADGGSAIVMATIPEPSTLMLCVLGLPLLTTWCHTSHRPFQRGLGHDSL